MSHKIQKLKILQLGVVGQRKGCLAPLIIAGVMLAPISR